ncbi:MAG: CoB--CoM heterodisulfide reductase iron-sulfur subunit B family protein [Candidatus Methylomirabilia bacterium]
MEVAYFPGCSLHSSSELYDVQCKSVLGKLDITLREIADWNCCGATSAAKVNDFLALALPARNLGIADATGLAEIVIPCSSCYSRTLVAKERLAADPKLAAEINAELGEKVSGRIKVSSILEVLLPKVRSGEIAKQVKKRLEGLKPAAYYGCLLTRFPSAVPVPDNVENPQGMETVCRALGAEPVEWGFKTDCCGASATVNDTDQALLLMSKIMKDALARGANCFVTTCPMCQLNLDAYQDQVRGKHGIRAHLPVYLITELLGIAFGMNPGELQINRHLEESVGLLKELRLA